MGEEPCIPCLVWYAPRDIGGAYKLGEINGYTIDFRLKEFRRVISSGEEKALITFAFSTPKGKALLRYMHKLRVALNTKA